MIAPRGPPWLIHVPDRTIHPHPIIAPNDKSSVSHFESTFSNPLSVVSDAPTVSLRSARPSHCSFRFSYTYIRHYSLSVPYDRVTTVGTDASGLYVPPAVPQAIRVPDP